VHSMVLACGGKETTTERIEIDEVTMAELEAYVHLMALGTEETWARPVAPAGEPCTDLTSQRGQTIVGAALTLVHRYQAEGLRRRCKRAIEEAAAWHHVEANNVSPTNESETVMKNVVRYAGLFDDDEDGWRPVTIDLIVRHTMGNKSGTNWSYGKKLGIGGVAPEARIALESLRVLGLNTTLQMLSRINEMVYDTQVGKPMAVRTGAPNIKT